MDITLGLLLLIAVAALAAGAIFFLVLQRMHDLRSRRFAWKNAQIVQRLLLTAIDQRSTMNIECSSEEMQGRALPGPCSSIEGNSAIVDVTELTHSLRSWNGEPVKVYFKLNAKGVGGFYAFSSHVLGMRDTSSGVSVKLALPSEIAPMQKRSFVRITPSPTHLLGIGLWSLNPALPLPQTHTKLGKPILSYRPDKLAQCTLLNLSAGGMRMKVPKELLQLFPAGLPLDSQLLCLLLLRSSEHDHRLPFWLVCTVVSLMDDLEKVKPGIIVGLKFKTWAHAEANSYVISWFPLGRSGEVPPLASWVIRHHMEQHKWDR